jgi:catechol 2,3-dioxygenase-like lactoylglutathione lyase family enzyme/predicted enzyme related to lactoylglutathione lyase
MKRSALLFAVILCCSVVAASDAPKRPRILGIARVQILTSDISAARSFYSTVLDHAHDCNWCEGLPGRSFLVNLNQGIALSNASSPAPSDLIEEIAFATDNIAALRRYLAANKIPVSKPNKPDDNYLSLTDPEGHRIGFLQQPGMSALTEHQQQSLDTFFPSKLRIIHAGIIVRDRAAEDRFYKDILGFHVYWHGGMKEGEDHWVDMQVPDGTDWIEYMLNVAPNADKHTLGVMNHIALGVEDIKPATERLRDDGVVPILEQPKIGRDGKWQLNLYDPDDTRVEFMEFTPTQKPCCSEYTGPHPKP